MPISTTFHIRHVHNILCYIHRDCELFFIHINMVSVVHFVHKYEKDYNNILVILNFLSSFPFVSFWAIVFIYIWIQQSLSPTFVHTRFSQHGDQSIEPTWCMMFDAAFTTMHFVCIETSFVCFNVGTDWCVFLAFILLIFLFRFDIGFIVMPCLCCLLFCNYFEFFDPKLV